MTVPKTKQELIEEQFPDLKGQGISLTDAAKKYKVPRETIQKWVYRSNYINFTDEESYPKLIDEAELALCAEIYNQRLATGLTGIPYFDNSDHIIEELKHPDLSEYRRKRAA